MKIEPICGAGGVPYLAIRGGRKLTYDELRDVARIYNKDEEVNPRKEAAPRLNGETLERLVRSLGELFSRSSEEVQNALEALGGKGGEE